MKTFDEAFNNVATNELIHQNLSAAKDYISNEEWTKFIYIQAKTIPTMIENSDNAKEFLAKACFLLQAIFQLGLLTGMEMEK